MTKDLNRRRTVWIVDDSQTDRERLKKLLAPDYVVETMQDGSSALERLATGTMPDLLLLDWVMPGVTGIQVCEYVRAAKGPLAQLPIILLTGQHASEDIVQAFDCGANDYVSKPFVDQELKARIKTLSESSRHLERAKSAEADVRMLLMNAPDPIFVFDAQGTISFVNEEGLTAVGRKREDVLGARFDSILPGLKLMNISVGPGAPLLPLPDVKIGDRLFSPSIRILPSDNAATTTVSLRDVTDRRKAEARRLDFYSIIAHDLRTPITSVMMRIQMAFRGKHGVLPPTLTADLVKIESSLRSQIAMINDFLELAKLEGVGYKIDRNPVEMTNLIKATMDDFQPLLEKSHLKWTHVAPSSKALALGDQQRLTQVLANLIGNAIKFTPANGEITTSVVVAENHIEASVEDNGRGIPEDELPHLFDRFTQTRESALDAGGTGLGLMIVREIIEAHDGVIGVESKPNVGSRFWFRLPRYEEATVAAH